MELFQVPAGYLWSKLDSKIVTVAPMEWDRTLTCDKIKLEADNMTINGSDGSSFRTAISTYVRSYFSYHSLGFYSWEQILFPDRSYRWEFEDWSGQENDQY